MTGARAAALAALVQLEKGHVERLREALDAAGLEGRDQAFAYELAHGVLRRERLLDHVLLGFAHRSLPKDPLLRCALRLGAYQLLFTGGVPPHAAVHETVELVRNNKGFANAVLRRVAERLQPRAADPGRPGDELPLGPARSFLLPAPLPANEVERLALLHSLPFFLLQRWLPDLGLDGLRQVAEAASAVPGVFLRAVGVDRETLCDELAAAGVASEPAEHPLLLRWTGGRSPFAASAFAAGRFVVQDPTSLRAAEAVPCGPGATVVDLCAAPGTKTSLLAERVRPGGCVHAFDLDPERRTRIAENVARLSLGDVVRVVDDARALPVGDAVLVDVPCSNTGVLGRRVEVRRRLTGSTIPRLVPAQRELLAQAIGRCRPGGAVVYSTCSIDRDENEGLVAAVLGSPGVPSCTVEAAQRTLPLCGQHDGGYFAVLRRGPG